MTGPAARWRTSLGGELAAEFLGTCVLILFGVGSVAMAVSALNQSGRGTKIFDASGDWPITPTKFGVKLPVAVPVISIIDHFFEMVRDWRSVLPDATTSLVHQEAL